MVMVRNSLKGMKLYDRHDYLCRLCEGKKILHLGATAAPGTKEVIESGRFLHSILMDICQEVVGMDINLEMINWLRDTYNITNIKYGDVENYHDYPQEKFDYIIAGEIFEHLSNPGKAVECLSAIAKPTTKLIITVPNAYSLKGFIRALARHELIHGDHTLHHSPHTLKSLLTRHGFAVDSYFGFVNGGTTALASLTNILLRYYPQLAEGIGVICSPISL
jgi:2-polyprenyl-3-methyl-5-hydroxy-6-metoxy-1,4-benzoquinol methylase